MKYYKLNYSSLVKEIGNAFPQIQNMSKGYNYDSNDSIYSISKCVNHLPTFIPNTEYFILNKKSYVTDLISSALLGNNGFIVSNKLKQIFEKHQLPIHKYYPIKIMHGNTVLTNFFWLHIISDYTSFIDFEASKFNILENYYYIRQPVKISSKEELVEQIGKVKLDSMHYSIGASEIVLAKNFDMNINLFCIGVFDWNYYINENLKNELVLNKITGINLTIANNIITSVPSIIG